jgi:zinc protease
VVHSTAVERPEVWIGWTLPGRYQPRSVPPELLADIVGGILTEPGQTDGELALEQPARRAGNRADPGFDRPSSPQPAWPATLAAEHFDAAVAYLSPHDHFIRAMTGLQVRSSDPDLARLETFALPGAQLSLLVCRAQLQRGDHPLKTAEHLLDRMRVLWYRTAPSQLRWFAFTVGLSSILRVARTVFEYEDPLQRALVMAQQAHFTRDPRAYDRIFAALTGTGWGRTEDESWEFLRPTRARLLLVLPAPASAPAHLTAYPRERRLAADPEPQPRPAAPALELPPPLEPARVRRRVLQNGLEVLAVRQPGLSVLSAGVLLRGGSALARPLGVAEVADHVVTFNRDRGDAFLYGALVNSAQQPDGVTLTVRAGSEHLAKMIAILASRLRERWVDDRLMANFRARTLPLLRADEARPEMESELQFWRALYGDHPYARRAGAEDLARVERSDVERWLRATYRPDNTVLAVAGDIDPERALALAELWLGDWKSDFEPPRGHVEVSFPRARDVVAPAPPPAGEQVLLVDRPGAREVELRWGCMLPESTEPAAAAAYQLAAELLDGRLGPLLRDRLAATADAEVSATLLAGGAASLQLSARCERDNLGPVVDALHRQLDGLADQVAPAEELRAARFARSMRELASDVTTPALVTRLLELRRRSQPEAALDPQPALRQVSADQVRAVFAGCRNRTVLLLSGDAASARAALATRR